MSEPESKYVSVRVERGLYDAIKPATGEQSTQAYINDVLRAHVGEEGAGPALAAVARGELVLSLRGLALALEQQTPPVQLGDPAEQRLPLLVAPDSPGAYATIAVERAPESVAPAVVVLGTKRVAYGAGFDVVGIEVTIQGLGAVWVDSWCVVGDLDLVPPGDVIECRTMPLPADSEEEHTQRTIRFCARKSSELQPMNVITANVRIECLGPVVHVRIAALVVPKLAKK